MFSHDAAQIGGNQPDHLQAELGMSRMNPELGSNPKWLTDNLNYTYNGKEMRLVRRKCAPSRVKTTLQIILYSQSKSGVFHLY